MAMHCPFCDSDQTRVIDSRPNSAGSEIRRRRVCDGCGRRFSTVERWERRPAQVVKKDGRREPFDREKIARGVRTACEKRPVAEAEIQRLVDEVEAEVREGGEGEIPSRAIGDAVMRRLRALDEVAFVRFASVYRQFGDLERFYEELKRLGVGGASGAGGAEPAKGVPPEGF
jgi:transcriptional repressor NrdR